MNRGNCELKRLICLGNYDVKGGQSLRPRLVRGLGP
jgi:hypothetical protein